MRMEKMMMMTSNICSMNRMLTFNRLAAALLVGTALTLFSGCQVDDNLKDEGRVEMKHMTFQAVYEDVDVETKTHRDESAKIYWMPGDAISLFYGAGTAGGSKFTCDVTAQSQQATFSGNIGVVTGVSEDAPDDVAFWGLYPYDATAECDAHSVTTSILSAQTSEAGTFANGMAPSLAKAPGLLLSFRNIWSGFRFTVTTEGFTSVTLRGNNNELIAGRAKIGMDANGNPEVLEILDGVKSVTVTAPGGGSFVPNEYYYLQIFPCTFEKGFTLEIKSPTKTGEYVISSKQEFKRSVFKKSEKLDTKATFGNTESIDGGNDPDINW